ncbi:MAG: metallopeptidase TldD-related protein, partial [Lachnospiraceae bacterium]
EVTDVETEGWEFYFIGHKLDQSRAKNTRHIEVSVYKKSEDGNCLGKAGGEIAPTATEKEAEEMIKKLLFQASLVKNPYYELVKPTAKEPESEVPAPAGIMEILPGQMGKEPESEVPTPAQIVADFIQVMRHLPETDTEDINSYEIFASRKKKHFMNSEGVELSSAYPSSMIEVVVNARKDGEEIELYRNYTSGSCGAKELAENLSKTLATGRDKLIAQPTPVNGEFSVVFSTDAALAVYDYFIRRLSAGMIYQKMSDWTVGKDAMPEAKGDRFSVKSAKTLPNSSANEAFDGEGSLVREETFLMDGIVRANYGSRQFSYYLGQMDSFVPGNFVVYGGTKNAEELRQGTYLEAVEFSDFQVDTLTGDIAGEIRLGYLWENGACRIVSGGSVTGNMRGAMKEMWASSEQRQYDSCLIPAVTRIERLTVTGAA